LDKFGIKSNTLKPKELCSYIIADFNNECLERTEKEMEQSQLAKRDELAILDKRQKDEENDYPRGSVGSDQDKEEDKEDPDKEE